MPTKTSAVSAHEEQVVAALADIVHGITSPFACGGTLVPDLPVAIRFNDGVTVAVTRAEGAYGQETALEPLTSRCSPAGFGHAKRTRHDPRVRNALQLGAATFSVEGFDPAASGVLEAVRQQLAPRDPNAISAELYNLNVYGRGGHFEPHKDTPRGDDMIGTLVVCLPSQFSSGDLVVSHRGVHRVFAWGQDIARQAEPTRIHWAAFFGDVDHAIQEVWGGLRVTLAYILRRVAGAAPAPEPAGSQAELLEQRLQAAVADRIFLRRGAVLAFPCFHMYSRDSRYQADPCPLTRSSALHLRGRDQQVASAAIRAGLVVTLQPYLIEACADEMWQLRRFPTARAARALGQQTDASDLESALELDGSADDAAEFKVTWVVPPPAFNMGPKKPAPMSATDTENPDPDAPALQFFHACEYSATGYFGNEASETEFYVFAALHVEMPPVANRLGRPREARATIDTATPRRRERRAPPGSLPEIAGPTIERGSLAWDELRSALTAPQRELPVANIELATRIRTFAERKGARTLGDLARYSADDLANATNLGRKSIALLPLAISTHLRSLATGDTLSANGLVECWRTVVSGLEPAPRTIAARRSGLDGDPMTLLELGNVFGVSRERIRQIESRLCERLTRQPWVTGVRQRVQAVLDDGVAPLDALASDPWWRAAAAQPSVVGFLVDDLLQTGAQVVEMDGRHWVSRHSVPTLTAAWDAFLMAAKLVPLPAPLESFEPLLNAVVANFGRHLADHFLQALRGRMQLDKGGGTGGERALVIGDSQEAWVLAALRAATGPLRVADLSERFDGRVSRFSDEVLFFGHGLVGLREHFPDFEEWQARLVPDCIRLVEELGPERQWSCVELLAFVRKEHAIPDWLSAYALAELIKAEGTLRYLGRLRVTLDASPQNETRVFVHHAVEDILTAAGAPMPRQDLLDRLAERLGTGVNGVGLVLTRPQFVQMDADRVGLLARDVPGARRAIARAADHVAAVLARRDRGLAERKVLGEVAALSRQHATWTVELAYSVLRSDGRFQFGRGRTVGLASWESTRVPTRVELVRSAIGDAGGRVNVAVVQARIEEHHGQRPSRGRLISLAMRVGASLVGDWMTWKGSAG